MGRVCGRLINGGVGIYLTSFHLLPCSPSLCGECEGLPTEHTALRTPLKEAAGDQHSGHGKRHPRHHRSCHGWEFPGGARKQACTCVCVSVCTQSIPLECRNPDLFSMCSMALAVSSPSPSCASPCRYRPPSPSTSGGLWGGEASLPWCRQQWPSQAGSLLLSVRGGTVGGAWCGAGQ